MQEFQDSIDLIRFLNKNYPRTKNAERNIGLYIEIKDWQWNMDWVGHNTADVLYEELARNGLETIDKCRDDIPIIV